MGELGFLEQHAEKINCTLIPVAVTKGLHLIPRLYSAAFGSVAKVEAGTVFAFSDTEALVATNPGRGAKLGTAMPLRIKVHPTLNGADEAGWLLSTRAMRDTFREGAVARQATVLAL